ncbi:MAG: methyltransferase domain-containing protein, partial [Proteobacteria bacterium]|nr:methyltransferase domain-containing protein [Pseudomonadota bacterium]
SPKPILVNLDIAYNMLQINSAQNQHPRYDIFNVNADIEKLPFKENSFDMAISSLAFQWLNDLDQALDGIVKVIKPNGILAFSILVEDSLSELKSCASHCDINLSVNEFPKIDAIKQIISVKSDIINFESQLITLEYSDIFELLNSMKSIGASYGSSKQTSKLTRNDFDKMNKFYLKNFSSLNRIRARWRILYAICRIKDNPKK